MALGQDTVELRQKDLRPGQWKLVSPVNDLVSRIVYFVEMRAGKAILHIRQAEVESADGRVRKAAKVLRTLRYGAFQQIPQSLPPLKEISQPVPPHPSSDLSWAGCDMQLTDVEILRARVREICLLTAFQVPPPQRRSAARLQLEIASFEISNIRPRGYLSLQAVIPSRKQINDECEDLGRAFRTQVASTKQGEICLEW